LLSYVPKCIEFIKTGLQSGGVLVHCAAGVSRSATIVCAYLMMESNLCAKKGIIKGNLQCNIVVAVELLRAKRPCICPNQGFRQQLDLWYHMNFVLEGSSKYHRRFQLLKQAIEYENTKILSTVTAKSADPDEYTTHSDVFVCVSCSRKLFDTNCVIEHEKGGLACSIGSENRFCDSYFVEPINWMNLTTSNELRCPNTQCNLQLGNDIQLM
jgi:dual specificity phosphatase 12